MKKKRSRNEIEDEQDDEISDQSDEIEIIEPPSKKQKISNYLEFLNQMNDGLDKFRKEYELLKNALEYVQNSGKQMIAINTTLKQHIDEYKNEITNLEQENEPFKANIVKLNINNDEYKREIEGLSNVPIINCEI